MSDNKANGRRNFLKTVALSTGSFGILNSNLPEWNSIHTTSNHYTQSSIKQFNMCGYAAPKIDIVKIGIIGLGERGKRAVIRLSQIENVVIKKDL